jgi:manganese efflux pump family protein
MSRAAGARGAPTTIRRALLALILVAGCLGLSNFAASIAIGLAGVDRAVRARIAVAFGVFEAGMPIVGLLAGRQLSHTLGHQAHIIGGLLLVAVGAQTTYGAMRAGDGPAPSYGEARFGRLLVLAAGLSVDNLVIGFALGADHTSLVLSVAVIAGVSVGLSLIGLELGSRLGASVSHHSETLGGVVLMLVGVAILTGLL